MTSLKSPRALTVLTALLFIPTARLHAQNLDWATPTAAEPAPIEGSGIEGVNAPPDFPIDPDPVPLDGGLTLLGAAGAAYAVRRLRQRQTP